MVDLVRAGRDPDDLAQEFEPIAQSFRNWIVQADKKAGRRADVLPGLSAAERDELCQLRRENNQLRVERDMVSNTASWFARASIGTRVGGWRAPDKDAHTRSRLESPRDWGCVGQVVRFSALMVCQPRP